MIRRFFVALCLLAALATPARAGSVTFSKDTTPIVSADWTDLGAGPALVQNHSAKMVYIAAAATKPAASAIGHALTAEMGARTFETTLHLWARVAVEATTATSPVVEVTAPAVSRVLPREDADASGAVNGSITASGQAVVLPLAGYNGATIAYWGTFAGVNLSFGVSYDGGTTYVAITARSVSGGAAATSTGAVSAAGAWTIYAPGATHVQASASAYTSGAMSVRAVPIAISADPAPSIGTLGAVTGTVATYANTATSTNGGLVSLSRLASAASGTNATVAKAAGGRFYKIVGYNAATSLRYLKIFNKSTTPTVGTDTPYAIFPLAPSAAFAIDFAPIGVTMTSGIAFGLTTGVADSDTGALTAGDVVALSLFYQ